MLRNIIKYGGLALVIIGIVLVMKNLFNSDSEFDVKKKDNTKVVSKNSYDVMIGLIDEETKKYLSGAKLVVKNASGSVITDWTTEESGHLVSNLMSGTYTLVEEKAPEGYKLQEEPLTFEVKKKDRQVVMSNKKMTEEEIKAYEDEQRELNTTSNEVGVDNTLSEKDVVATMMAIVCIVSGVFLIFRKREA